MRSPKFNRRNFLRTTAVAAASYPLLDILSSVRVNAAPPPRVMFVYIPDGCIPDRFHPTVSADGFTLNQMTEPLSPVKQHMVFLDGLTMYAGGATHEGGIRKVLTGTADVSLDIFLGQKFAGQTAHSSLQLGVAANFENGSGSMSFIGAGQEVKPDDDPLNAFSRVFGGVSGGGQGGGSEDLVARRKKSVLDAVLGDLTRLKARYGSAERAKLETHTESVREVERRITAGVGGGAVAEACNPATFNSGGYTNSPTDFYPKTFHKEDNFETVSRLQMDLGVLALSCNATRVVSLMLSHPVSPTHIRSTGVTTGHHDASHFGNPDSDTAKSFIALQRHFTGEIAHLVQKLEDTPDGEGSTLLDNTLVMVCSELGDSNAHDHNRVPFMLAGRAGGLRTGRLLDYRGSNGGQNESHAKLLVSIANLMGVTDVDSYGYVGHGRGPLPGL